MIRPTALLIATIFATGLLATPAQARDPDDRVDPPDVGWTAAACKQAMRAQVASAQAMVDKKKKPKPGWSLEDVQKNEAAIGKALAAIAEQTRARIDAQATAAGGWGAGKVYDTVNWKGTDYAVGGCLRTKDKLPLKVMERIAKAPEKPASLDGRLAGEARKLMAIQKKRQDCWKKTHREDIVKCHKPYHDYRWLDRYPVE